MLFSVCDNVEFLREGTFCGFQVDIIRVYMSVHVEVRGQLSGASLLLPSYGFQGSNSGHQVLQGFIALDVLELIRWTKLASN